MTKVITNSLSANAKELKILTYKIENKAPVTLFGRTAQAIVNLSHNLYQIRPHQQQQQAQYPGSNAAKSHIVDMPWPKMRFLTWIEGLKQQYKIGDLVTMLQIPVIPNCVPIMWEIVYINELHKDCKFDSDILEPICLSVRYPSGVINQKCPATLRKLTKEELALVELRNQKPAGSA